MKLINHDILIVNTYTRVELEFWCVVFSYFRAELMNA